MSESAFSIFDALSAWGKTLPGWQHFLLNKLVVAVELTDESLDEVFGEYLIDQGLGESGEPAEYGVFCTLSPA